MVSLRLVELDASGNETSSISLRTENVTDAYPIACRSFDLGFPVIRESVEDATDQDGVYDSTEYHSSRAVTFDLSILGPTKDVIEEQLRGLCNPRKRPWLYVNRPSWNGERRMLLRPSNFSFVSDKAAGGRFNISMAFSCPTGRMESVLTTVTSMSPPQTAPNGFFFPVTMPITFGGGRGSASTVAINTGNADVYPLVYFYGLMSNPSFINRTTGERIAFTYNGGLTIADGHYLAADMLSGRALDDGTGASRHRNIDFGVSTWVRLAPGVNELEFTAASVGQSAQIDVLWRNSWI